MFMQWKDRYRIGHDQVDRQHQHLFELINDLHAKIEAGHGSADPHEAIHNLIDYALVHFSDEEALMQEVGFEDIERHRWQHSEFAGRIADMALAWGEGKSVSAVEIRDFLAGWLLDHILAEDMKIASAVRRAQPTRG